MFHLYGRIKGFRPKSIKLLKTRPTLTVFPFFFFSNLLMSNMYLMYMDMINEDRFAYHVLIRRLRGSVMNLRYLNYDGTSRVFKLIMNHQVLNDDVIKLKKETPHDMWLVYI